MKTLALSIGLAVVCWSAPLLALETVKVTDGIYAFVGETQPRTPQNLANNATFGLIVTGEGAVLVDPGGSWKGAGMIDAAIAKVTTKPVRFVINTGGQDHRWLGNDYWRKKGARIIASKAAVRDQKDRGSLQLTMLTNVLGGHLDGTEPAYADVTFDESHDLEFGGMTIAIRHTGQAHTPGDSFVWVASKKTVFTGDIVYVDRLLGVMSFSNSKSWLEAFKAVAALKPAHVVPGHGAPTTLKRAQAETYDYLVDLRGKVGRLLDKGGDMIGAAKLDQSAFRHLALFDVLAGRNAEAVFAEMEFE